jgi:large subunit ribosomal protein L10
MATKEKKQEIVQELERIFSQTEVAIVADLNGFTVEEITKFRRKLDKDEAKCRIAKNTLIKLASKDSKFAQISEVLHGPSALIYSSADPAQPAKTAVEYFKSLKKGSIRGAVFEGKLLNESDVKALASLPSKHELLSQIVSSLAAPTSGIVSILNTIIGDIGNLAEEVAKKNNNAA